LELLPIFYKIIIFNMPKCPVCNSSSFLLKSLTKDFIESSLVKFYHESIPEINLIDYSIYKCNNCTLEFCDPMFAGTKKFYDWMIHQPNYYPTYRWEWGIVLKQVLPNSNDQTNLVEVGCGNGDFLKFIKKSSSINALGMDTSESAISVCAARDLNAICDSIESFSNKENSIKKFDIACSFHCLEHVEDPLGFVKEMKSMLKFGGSIFLSTPYSPMCYESQWYDPLNHPPHHMSRWNKRSYEELAKILDMQINFHTHEPATLFQRTFLALDIKYYGFKIFHSRKKMVLNSIFRFKDFYKEYHFQRKRDVVNGKPAPDVILVQLIFKYGANDK